MIKADIHTHTKYSHAVDSVPAMAEAARAAGLSIYGFSEHSPRPAGYAYPSDYQESLLATYPDYIAEVQTLCRASTPEFTVLSGLEVDFMADEVDFARKSAAEFDFDYIIGGLHFQGHWGFDHSQSDWDKLGEEERFECYARYYADLGTLCSSRIAHIIAHPDLIKLFSIDSFNKWLSTAQGQTTIQETFTLMRDLDLIMEVSSAGLRKSCREIYPGPRIMELASRLGLKICISSDAHTTGQIAYAFDQLEDYARSYGYRESWIVQQKEKRALPFE